jgi:chromosome segregation ATPase
MALRVLQKTLLAVYLSIILLACSTDKDHRVRELESENNYLKKQLDLSIDNARYKENLISEIEEELTTIDSSFNYLSINAESNYFDEQADKIQGMINNLKNKLNKQNNEILALNSKSNNLIKENESLVKLIERYKSILISKENQLNNLKKVMKEQEDIIIVQRNEIKHKIDTINKKNKELEEKRREIQKLEQEIVDEQIKAYQGLSKELYETANSLPEIKGIFTKKSKDALAILKNDLHQRSEEYKQKAEKIRRSNYE